jgi:hypothetical protein
MGYEYRDVTWAYSLVIPDEWEWTRKGETVAIFRTIDGVGDLNVSTFFTTSKAPRDAESLLNEAIRPHSVDARAIPSFSGGNVDGAFAGYSIGRTSWRVVDNRARPARHLCHVQLSSGTSTSGGHRC